MHNYFALPKWFSIGIFIALTVFADAAIALNGPLMLRALAAALLVFVLPGWALLRTLFAPQQRIPAVEKLVLSLGVSVAVSVWLFWIVFMLPVPLDLSVLLGALNMIIFIGAALALWRARLTPPHESRIWLWRERMFWIALIVVAAVSLAFTLARLHYAELARDERDVASAALDILIGKKQSLYSLPKGPAQIILAAWFMRLTDSLVEWVMRLPFALCGVLSALSLALIARLRLKSPFVIVAGLLLILEGLLLPLSRIVQYQMFVMAMVQLAFYCALRAWAVRHSAHAFRYWLLAAFFVGTGLLGHYDAGFIAPALAYLFVCAQWRQRLTRAVWLKGIALGLMILLIAAPFYVLLVAQPGARRVIESLYLNGRVGIGRGPFNHLQQFFLDTWYRSMIYWVPVQLLIAAACALALKNGRERRLPFVVITALFMLTIPLLIVKPDALTLDGLNFSFAVFALAFVLLWRVMVDPFWVAVTVWLFGVAFFTGFWMANPLDHYFLGLTPLLLIALGAASHFLVTLRGWLRSPWVYRTAIIGVVVWLGWIGTHEYLTQIAYYGATVAMHPERALPLFNFSAPDEPERVRIYNVGWRTVAALYEAGEMRGEYDTNESLGVPHYYLYHVWQPPNPSPRYFIIAYPQKQFSNKAVPENLLETHDLWGTITVEGEAQIQIYQRKQAQPLLPRVLADEAFENEWAQIARVSRFESYRSYRRDDSAFYQLAHALRSQASSQDAIVFDVPQVRGVLAQYDSSNVPYLTNIDYVNLDAVSRVWGVWWNAGGSEVERWLGLHTYPSSAQWFGNVRLRAYGVAADRPMQEQHVQLGDVAMLVGASVPPATLRAGEMLPIQLVWRAEQRTATHYKVFVHVTDTQGKLLAQMDDEPVAGLRPTTGWHAGERIDDRIGVWLPLNISAGRYQVTAGLYERDSAQRVSAFAPNGSRLVTDAILLGEFIVAGH